MALQLLELPPELLVRILALLPLRALLDFSQTSRHAHSLGNSNLHTLNLGICPIRTPCLTSRPNTAQCMQPQYWASAALEPTAALPSGTSHGCLGSNAHLELQKKCHDDNNPHRVWVQIPDVHTYDYVTLLRFHDALIRSILVRHSDTLHNLDLSLWQLTTPIAEAISRLSSLRRLSIRIEDDLYARAVPRTCMAMERREQGKAWSLLAQKAVWARRLRTLRIDNADLSYSQLATLLRRCYSCQELWLAGCRFVGKELWQFLGNEWRGSTRLQILGVAECGGALDETTRNAIGRLAGLQYLDLYGCYGADKDTVKLWNKDVWHIPEVTLPGVIGDGHDLILEVDPAYMNEVEYHST